MATSLIYILPSCKLAKPQVHTFLLIKSCRLRVSKHGKIWKHLVLWSLEHVRKPLFPQVPIILSYLVPLAAPVPVNLEWPYSPSHFFQKAWVLKPGRCNDGNDGKPQPTVKGHQNAWDLWIFIPKYGVLHGLWSKHLTKLLLEVQAPSQIPSEKFRCFWPSSASRGLDFDVVGGDQLLLRSLASRLWQKAMKTSFLRARLICWGCHPMEKNVPGSTNPNPVISWAGQPQNRDKVLLIGTLLWTNKGFTNPWSATMTGFRNDAGLFDQKTHKPQAKWRRQAWGRTKIATANSSYGKSEFQKQNSSYWIGHGCRGFHINC